MWYLTYSALAVTRPASVVCLAVFSAITLPRRMCLPKLPKHAPARKLQPTPQSREGMTFRLPPLEPPFHTHPPPPHSSCPPISFNLLPLSSMSRLPTRIPLLIERLPLTKHHCPRHGFPFPFSPLCLFPLGPRSQNSKSYQILHLQTTPCPP